MSIEVNATLIKNDADDKIIPNEGELAVLVLSDEGIIHDCNRAGANLLGYLPRNLPKLHISSVLPKLAKIELIKGARANPYLRFLSRIGHHFEVVSMNGVHFEGKLFFSDVEDCGVHRLIVMIQPVHHENILC